MYYGQFVDVYVVEVWYQFDGGYEGEFVVIVFVDVWGVGDVQFMFVQGGIEGFVQQVVDGFVVDLLIEMLFDYFGWDFVWMEVFDLCSMGDFVQMVVDVGLQVVFWQ